MYVLVFMPPASAARRRQAVAGGPTDDRQRFHADRRFAPGSRRTRPRGHPRPRHPEAKRGWATKEGDDDGTNHTDGPGRLRVVFRQHADEAHAVAEGLEGVAPTVQEVSAAADRRDRLPLAGGGRPDPCLRSEPRNHPGRRRTSWCLRTSPASVCASGSAAYPHPPLHWRLDTRAEKVRHLPMSAAQAAGRMLKRRGYTLVRKPAGFVVQDVEGPLGCGETERAIEWGRTVGREAQLQRAASALDHAHPARGRTR
jgi:hypothetical protein